MFPLVRPVPARLRSRQGRRRQARRRRGAEIRRHRGDPISELKARLAKTVAFVQGSSRAPWRRFGGARRHDSRSARQAGRLSGYPGSGVPGDQCPAQLLFPRHGGRPLQNSHLAPLRKCGDVTMTAEMPTSSVPWEFKAFSREEACAARGQLATGRLLKTGLRQQPGVARDQAYTHVLPLSQADLGDGRYGDARLQAGADRGFWAAYLMAKRTPTGSRRCNSRSSSACFPYKTAWLLATKLRRAMVAPEHAAGGPKWTKA